MERPHSPLGTALEWLSSQMPALLRNLKSLQYRIIPGRCLLCRAPTHRHLDLCEGCDADLPRITTGCIVCSLPLDAPGICGQCLTEPPHFDSCRSLFIYQEPVSGLIRRFKHHQGFTEGKVLAELFASQLGNILTPGNRPNLIIPVPTHWRRRWHRGFNQTELLARQLSHRLSIPVRHALKAIRHHPPQQSLGKGERRANIRNSMSLRGSVEGLHVALLDDVVTTGATADELARLLKRHGAMEVEIWSLARTPATGSDEKSSSGGKPTSQPR